MSIQLKKLCLFVASLCLLADTSIYAAEIVKGKSAPSSRKELAFPFQGIIGNVLVKDGDTIKKGQVLVELDLRLEAKRLEGAKLEADRSVEIRAKEADLENKILERDRKKEMFERKAMTESEYRQAELEVKLAIANVEVAKHEQLIKIAEKELQEVRVELMKLPSPVDGIVEKIIQTEGEVADISKPSIVVQANDPIYINVNTLAPTVVQKLAKDQELRIRYIGSNEDWKSAKINFIAQVDPRAQTQAIRLELPNPDKRATGLEVEVEIP